jgi:hypothetical protein
METYEIFDTILDRVYGSGNIEDSTNPDEVANEIEFEISEDDELTDEQKEELRAYLARYIERNF